MSGFEGRLELLNNKVEAAHERLDKMERLIRDDLKEMKTEFGEVVAEIKLLLRDNERDMKEVMAWMNRGKGWAAAAMLAASVAGGLIAKRL